MCDFLKHLFRKKCQLQNPELKGYVSTFFPISEFSYFVLRFSNRVSVQGVKSLGGHFTFLRRGFVFYEVKKKIVIIFQKENTFTLLIILRVKSLQKTKRAQISYYDPQSARKNLQSP